MMSTKRAQPWYGSRWILRLLCLAVVCPFAKGDTQYYKHTFFDNSLEPDAYYYSSGKASSPSTLELIHGRLPVSRDFFYTPPNALRLKWHSVPDGGWEAGISAINFRNREINFQGDTLYFWCLSREGISPAKSISRAIPSTFGACQERAFRPAPYRWFKSRTLVTTFRLRFRWKSSFQIWPRENGFKYRFPWRSSRLAPFAICSPAG